MADLKPYEIARETVKQLTVRKLLPTPDNYQRIYHEIAGTKRLQPFPEAQLQEIANLLPTKTPGQQRLHAQFESAVRNHNWTGLQTALVNFSQAQPVQRIAADGIAPVGHHAALAIETSNTPAAEPLPPALKEQIARLIEHAQPAVGLDDSKMGEQTASLTAYLRKEVSDPAMLKQMIADFNHRLSFTAEEQGAIKSALLELLQMVFKNIGELSVDDRWLKGQMDGLMAAATPPITLRHLEDIRAKLKDVIFKQSEAKSQTVAAQEAIKRELAGFIERLTAMSASTSEFGGKIEQSAKRLETAQRIEDIAPVLQEAIAAARTMTVDTQRASDELKSMREKAQQAEEQVQRLQNELDKASAQARHDPLTGVLNRKGLDEAIEREISSAKRKGTQLCLSLLDIDNFKKLNDSYGHDVGDVALKHLTKITRDCIRPQDTLARYGGEEFIVVLPDATLEQAIEAMTRVQRELTKHFFLAGKDKVLITFSAGVAALGPEESAELAVSRADQAMYLAKRSGKNRVVGA